MANFLTIVSSGLIKRLSALVVSTGAIDADKIIATTGDGKLDSSLVNWATPGSIGSTVANTGKFTTIGIGSTVKETRSVSVPSSPSTGDLWLELDGSNYPKYGWLWRWNGTYWLSPDQTVDFSQSNVASGNYYYFHSNPAFNYFFKALNISSFATVLQTAANFFTFAVNRASSNNAISVIASTTTNGNASNTWVRKNISVNVHVNTSVTDANVFSLNTAMTGTAGDLYVVIQAVYNLARL